MKTTLTLTTLLLAATGFAKVTPYASDFSDKESVAGWSASDTGATIALSKSALDFDGGDKKTGDGSLILRAGDNTPGNDHFTYALTGKPEKDEVLTLSGTAFNANNSHNSAYFVELVRSDGKVLAKSKSLGSDKTTGDKVKPVDFSLTYTATQEDSGFGLDIRITEQWNNKVRMGFVDTLRLTSSASDGSATTTAAETPKPATETAKNGITPFKVTFADKADIEGWKTDGKGNLGISKSPADGDAGDKVAGDGALILRVGDSTPGNETFSKALGGTLAKNQTLTLSGTVYNAVASHNSHYHAEFVRADGKVLAKSNPLGSNPTKGTVKPVEIALTYTATEEDEGKGVSLLFREHWNATARSACIDNLELTVSDAK